MRSHVSNALDYRMERTCLRAVALLARGLLMLRGTLRESSARAVQLDPRTVDLADCHGNVCRVKLTFETSEAATEFQEAANPSQDYTVYVAGSEEDRVTMLRADGRTRVDLMIEHAPLPDHAVSF